MSANKSFQGFADESQYIHTGLGKRKIEEDSKVNVDKITSIPIIDISHATSPILEERKAVAREIFQACSQIGFFYVKNHGVDEAVIETVQREGLRFFEQLSHEEKMTISMALNEKEYLGYAPRKTELPGGAIKRSKCKPRLLYCWSQAESLV